MSLFKLSQTILIFFFFWLTFSEWYCTNINQAIKLMLIISFQLGCVGILIIALITDHCCQLIIKCKKAAVQIVLDSAPKSDDIESLDTDMTDMRNTVEKRMFFGEIGRIALGKKGVFLVNAALLTTQYGFCIGYFIFLGNTITSMFPPPHNFSNDTNTTAKSHGNYHPPAFALLILVPLIPLILFSYIRSIRKLGPVSFAANVALLVAFVSVVGYMLSGKFHVIMIFNPLTPKIKLLILPSSCHIFPCKLVMRICC